VETPVEKLLNVRLCFNFPIWKIIIKQMDVFYGIPKPTKKCGGGIEKPNE